MRQEAEKERAHHQAYMMQVKAEEAKKRQEAEKARAEAESQKKAVAEAKIKKAKQAKKSQDALRIQAPLHGTEFGLDFSGIVSTAYEAG